MDRVKDSEEIIGGFWGMWKCTKQGRQMFRERQEKKKIRKWNKMKQVVIPSPFPFPPLEKPTQNEAKRLATDVQLEPNDSQTLEEIYSFPRAKHHENCESWEIWHITLHFPLCSYLFPFLTAQVLTVLIKKTDAEERSERAKIDGKLQIKETWCSGWKLMDYVERRDEYFINFILEGHPFKARVTGKNRLNQKTKRQREIGFATKEMKVKSERNNIDK